MKYSLLVILSCISLSCFSQDTTFVYPAISKIGDKISDFVPAHWNVLDTVSCDFNHKNKRDYAIVIETEKPVLVKNDTICGPADPFYPKMLIIIFKQQNNKFRLSSIGTKLFGTCNWGVEGEDPYSKIFIRRNTLGIEFVTGGSLRDVLDYFFQYRSKNWYLVGSDENIYEAGQPGSSTRSIDYLSRIIEDYNQDSTLSGRKEDVTLTKLKHRYHIKLKDFVDLPPIPLPPLDGD